MGPFRGLTPRALRSEASAKAERAAAVRQEIEQATAQQRRIVEETTELDRLEESHPKRHLLPQLRALVMLNESLKRQEAQFKAGCKEQLAELQAMLGQLASEEGSDEETKRMLEVRRAAGPCPRRAAR